jgi:hypothetical protein
MAEPTFSPLMLAGVTTEHVYGVSTVVATFKSHQRKRDGGAPKSPMRFDHLPLNELGELLSDMTAAYIHRLDAVRIQE